MDPKLSKRFFLILLKYTPWLIAIGYLLGIIFAAFNIPTIILTNFVGISILPILFILCSSFALGFCIWHRLPIYYVIVSDLINLIDYLIGIPISLNWLLFWYILMFGICAILGAYLKNKYNVKKRNIKTCIA